MGECSSNNAEPKASKMKWPCAYCTYLNWEASLKCVICCQPRNRPMIIEELGVIEEFGSKLVLSSDRFVKDTAPRWSCPSCTYSNCRRTKRCVICGCAERPSRFEKETSPTEHHGTRNNDTVGTILSKDMLNKWTCTSCTYDNWPIASKCTLCGRLRSVGAVNENSEASRQQKQTQQRNNQSRTPSPKGKCKQIHLKNKCTPSLTLEKHFSEIQKVRRLAMSVREQRVNKRKSGN